MRNPRQAVLPLFALNSEAASGRARPNQTEFRAVGHEKL